MILALKLYFKLKLNMTARKSFKQTLLFFCFLFLECRLFYINAINLVFRLATIRQHLSGNPKNNTIEYNFTSTVPDIEHSLRQSTHICL